ncbi:MAG: hypothetical protein AAF402_09540 [Pseudomonadota bacterium]
MTEANSTKVLEKKLSKIIKKMRRIQKRIAADGEPVSGGEIEQLTRLGRKYQNVVQELSSISTDKLV